MLFLTSNLNCDEISLDVVKDDWYETEIIIFSDGNPNTTSSSDELESIELTQQRTFDRDIFFTLTHDNNIIRNLNPSIVKDLFWFRNKNIDRSLTSRTKWESEGEQRNPRSRDRIWSKMSFRKLFFITMDSYN